MGIVLLLCGVACLAYGVSIFLVFSGSAFYCVWLVMGAALVAWGQAMRTGAWDALPALVRHAVDVVVMAGLGIVVALGCVIMRDAHRDPPQGLDYIVVLGAQVHDGRPSVVLRYRLDTAYEYLSANPNTLCVVSGGQGPNEPYPEAQVMAEYLIGRGIDEARISQELASQNTAENIRLSRELIPVGASVGIVTNDFHVFRAMRIALTQGLDAHGVPSGSVLWYFPNNLLRECLGVVKDVLVGNIAIGA